MDTRTTDFPICRKCSDWLEDIDAVINQQVVAKDDSAEISRAISNAWMFIIIGIIFAAAIFGIVFIVLGIMQLNEAEGKKRLAHRRFQKRQAALQRRMDSEIDSVVNDAPDGAYHHQPVEYVQRFGTAHTFRFRNPAFAEAFCKMNQDKLVHVEWE